MISYFFAFKLRVDFFVLLVWKLLSFIDMDHDICCSFKRLFQKIKLWEDPGVIHQTGQTGTFWPFFLPMYL